MMRAILFLAPLVVLSLSLVGCGEQASWEELRQKADTLWKDNKCDEAIATAKKALETAERTSDPGHFKVAETLYQVGSFNVKARRYKEAEPFLKRCLEIREKTLGKDHLGSQPREENAVLVELGKLYYEQALVTDSLEQREELLKKSLEMRERAMLKDHPEVAEVLVRLGHVYEEQKKYAEAEPLYKRSLEIWEKAFRADHPDFLLHVKNLWWIYEKQEKYAQAEPLLERELQMMKAKLGPDDPEVNMLTQDLATIYEKQGKKREAYELLKAARLIPGEESEKEPARVASVPEKSAQSAAIIIHEMKVNPSIVRGGAKFTLSFDYSVADSQGSKSKLPAEISYSLRQGGATLSEQPPVRSEVEKGKKLHTEKTIGAPRKSGSYELGVRIQSEGATAEKFVPLRIR